MKYTIVFGLATFALLAGCGSQDKGGIPVKPRFTGPPYHLSLGATPAKPSKSGLTIPPIKYTADPDAPSDSLATRAILVVRIDTASVKSKGPMTMDQIIMGAVDLPGTEGTLSADYMDATEPGRGHPSRGVLREGEREDDGGAYALIALEHGWRRGDRREADYAVAANQPGVQEPAFRLLRFAESGI